tara:strand:+ start:1306 stop:1722 length:417 start_codon:yes stop_codon:yes gene_type:complete
LNRKISDKDKKDWESFLSSNEKLPNKDKKLFNNKEKIKTFDLHGFSLAEANEKIKSLIYNAYHQEIKKLIIVTGKGIHSQNNKDPYVSKKLGILKHSVPEFIKNNDELMSMINNIKDADIQDGGSGAFYIYLKKKVIK